MVFTVYIDENLKTFNLERKSILTVEVKCVVHDKGINELSSLLNSTASTHSDEDRLCVSGTFYRSKVWSKIFVSIITKDYLFLIKNMKEKTFQLSEFEPTLLNIAKYINNATKHSAGCFMKHRLQSYRKSNCHDPLLQFAKSKKIWLNNFCRCIKFQKSRLLQIFNFEIHWLYL